MQPTGTVPLKSDFDVDPPPYPGPPFLPSQSQSLFRIPSFEDVIALSQFEDSMRLPTYQARHLARYHPYWRFRPNREPQLDESRYFNTVYDDEYIPLQVPPAIPPIIRAPTVVVQAGALASPVHNARGLVRDLEEEHRQRVYRLRAVIAEFVLAVKRAIEARPGRPVIAPATVETVESAPEPTADPDTSI